MTKKYDNIIFIGRFSPWHNGHQAVADYALTLSDNLVILIGSTNVARNIKNPFTSEERHKIILKANPSWVRRRVLVRDIEDSPYNDNLWVQSVQNATQDLIGKTALIGYHKDASSFYLDMFPQWDFIEAKECNGTNATDIRRDWYSGHDYSGRVSPSTYEFMRNFNSTETFAQLKREWKFIKEYKRKWETAPYAPTFVTVDSVFVHSGHVLLVKRGAEPGKGLWALPGGFLDQNETLEEGSIRELREETRLKLPEKVIKGSQKGFKVFDHPHRSLRGRTITNAFYYEIQTGELPKVKGDDDAADAQWVSLGKLKDMQNQFFEDHSFILSFFLKF